jgi:cytochrome c peroxidase
MRRATVRAQSLALWALGLLSACSAPDRPAPIESPYPALTGERHATAEDPFEPLPAQIPVDREAARLGATLYADPILSSDRSLTCWSCHDPAKGGADGLPHASVPSRPAGSINTGTVFNLPFNVRFNRNGKFDSLRAQVDGPVTSPHVMAMRWPELVARLRADRSYRRRFRAVYDEGVTRATIRDAIASFERTLLTPHAAFDRFVRGDETALDAEQRAGYALFKSLGCASCHQGINIGGNMFARLGVLGDYFADRDRRGRGETDADAGRFQVTHRERDRHVFRVPSLRNVACTAPYLHDGSQASLADVITVMGRYQLGRELTDEQVGRLAAFLRSLTGDYRGHPLCGEGEEAS